MSIPGLTAGTELLQYRLIERIGAFVWRALDGRSGKEVAVKILTRQLPRDAPRRDEVFKHVRLGAALYHPFLVPVLDVAAAEDTLLLIMSLIDVQPMTKIVTGKPQPDFEVFRAAYQIADVLKFLQLREVVHGNVAGDSVMMSPDGHVRLGGLNLTNLLPRKEGTSSPAYQQKGSDTRAVSYMSPEQIGGQPVDVRSDVFSLGVVMYEMATGALPWPRGAAADVARAIVEGKPQSPKSIHPGVDPKVVDVIGKFIPRDPFSRLRDFRQVVDELMRLAPDAVQFASVVAAKTNATVAGATKKEERDSVLLIADVDEAVEIPDAAAKMQQVVGEAAYLFDGHVVDPFGARLVAEMPSLEAAIEAGRKAEFDLAARGKSGEWLPARLLLHAGELTIIDGRAEGEAVSKGFAALAGAPHRQLLFSESFVKKGRGSLRLRNAGARGGMKVFEVAVPELMLPVAKTEVDGNAAATVAADLPAMHARSRALLFGGVGLLLLVSGIGGILSSRHATPAPVPTKAATAVDVVPRAVVLAPFSAEGAEPALLEKATALRLALAEILRATPDVHLLDAPAADAVTFSATLRTVAGGAEVVPTRGGQPATPISLADDGVALQQLAGWVGRQIHVVPRTAAPAALSAFSNALAARAAGDDAKTQAALQASVAADPSFLPVQRMAMSYYVAHGNDDAALEAAKQVVRLEPSDVEAARFVARGCLARGDVPAALDAYGAVLKQRNDDIEALNTIGHYAFSVGDVRHFSAALAHLRRVTSIDVGIHEPDLLTASGRFDEAIQKYYDIEVNNPDNPALSLKIGRIAVLRRTPDIARLEETKLAKSDPTYGAHLLAAYIAAEGGQKEEAERELMEAMKASRPGDDSWTSAAEVYAITGENRKVLGALQTASDRREPTISYILADPLFTFLSSDAHYQKICANLAMQQQQIRAALARIAI